MQAKCCDLIILNRPRSDFDLNHLSASDSDLSFKLHYAERFEILI